MNTKSVQKIQKNLKYITKKNEKKSHTTLKKNITRKSNTTKNELLIKKPITCGLILQLTLLKVLLMDFSWLFVCF